MGKMRLTYTGLVVAVVGALVASGLVAQAGNPATEEKPSEFVAEVPAPKVGDPINEAEMEDLFFISEQDDIPLDQVIARYGWNNNFSLMVSEIRDAYPREFSGAEIVDARKAWISFKDSPPDDVQVLLHSFTQAFPMISIEVKRGQGYSEIELETAIEGVYFAVYDSPYVEDASITFHAEIRTIVASVVLVDSDQTPSLEHLSSIARQALTKAAGGDQSGFDVTVILSEYPTLGGLDSANHHHGGESLSTCTSGFGTRAGSHTTGTRGISTAGHCGNSQSDDGVALTFQSEHEGTHGDFQWHTGPRTRTDDFYSGSASTLETNLRDVAAVGTPTVGQSLCKNGKTNKKSCQEVRKLGVCHAGSCNLVQMGARLAASGDSGGPIFFGSTAYGLHKGFHYDPVWPADRDTFSRTDRIDDALGVYIATN